MRAGKLKSRGMLQVRGTTQDAAGQPTAAWVDVAPVWADIKFLSGLESIKSDSIASVARASIRIRYRAGVKADMRLVFGADVFDIRAVLPDAGDHVFLDLVAEVGVNQG